MLKITTVTDLPCKPGEDLFETKRYIDGLYSFLKQCETPLTVAIQGGWGSGKTSLINNLQERFQQDSNIVTLYYNTWQYEQLKKDNLYTSLATTLMLGLTEAQEGTAKAEGLAEKAKKIGLFLGKVAVAALAASGKDSVEVAEDAYERYFEQEVDETRKVAQVRQSFQDLVSEALNARGSDRLVVFVDDLDRLSPQMAIELLEAIKMFLDVEKCIFVLAIDYDVVVQGVRVKYDREMSIQKCRSFFDKIIQVPFRIPENDYSSARFIKSYVSDDSYANMFSEFIDRTVGANPRMLKRTLNSYSLILAVRTAGQEKGCDRPLDRLTLFMMLALQNAYPELYQYLASIADDAFDGITSDEDTRFTDELEEHLKRGDFSEGDLKAVIETNSRILAHFLNFIKENNNGDIIAAIKQALSETSVTGLSASPSSAGNRKASETIAKVVVGLEGHSNKQAIIEKAKANQGLTKSVELMIEDFDGHHLNELIRILTEKPAYKQPALAVYSAEMEENLPNALRYHRAHSEIIHAKTGTLLWIGTSSGFAAKVQHVNEILAAVNQVAGAGARRTLHWYAPEGVEHKL